MSEIEFRDIRVGDRVLLVQRVEGVVDSTDSNQLRMTSTIGSTVVVAPSPNSSWELIERPFPIEPTRFGEQVGSGEFVRVGGAVTGSDELPWVNKNGAAFSWEDLVEMDLP